MSKFKSGEKLRKVHHHLLGPTPLNLKYNFMETPRKFIIAKLSIRKLGYSSSCIISNDEDPILRIQSFAIIDLNFSRKVYFNLIAIHHACKHTRNL